MFVKLVSMPVNTWSTFLIFKSNTMCKDVKKILGTAFNSLFFYF